MFGTPILMLKMKLFFVANLSKKHIILSRESVKTKESNSCEKYDFSINAFYKINLSPILKKFSKKLIFVIFHFFKFLPKGNGKDKDNDNNFTTTDTK